MSISLITESISDFFEDYDLNDKDLSTVLECFFERVAEYASGARISKDSSEDGEAIGFLNKEFELLLNAILRVAPDLSHVGSANLYVCPGLKQEPFQFEFTYRFADNNVISFRIADLASLEEAISRIGSDLTNSDEDAQTLQRAITKANRAIVLTKKNGHVLSVDI